MTHQGGAQVERATAAAEERGHLRGGVRRLRHGHLLLPPQRRQLLPDLKVMLEVSDSSSFDTEYVTIVCDMDYIYIFDTSLMWSSTCPTISGLI